MDHKTKTHIDHPVILSSSPHIKEKDSINKIMWNVIFALMPAAIFSVFNFGLPALITILTSIFGAVACELLIQIWRKKEITIFDGSAVLTGLLLAMCLPPQISFTMTLFGSVAAIGIAKHMFGGLGHNVFNPAHVGRAFLMISYPVAMTTWTASHLANQPSLAGKLDTITSATPLGILKLQGYDKLLDTFGGKESLYKTLFFGNHAGSLGETPVFLLLLGGIYLIVRGYIKWQVPAVMIGTVGLLTWIFGSKSGLFQGDPLFHMMAGGLVIGAFFMATDMVTIPITTLGQIIFAFGSGAITVLIRLVGGYPEGVCYSILLMNALTPAIDKIVVPKIFGVFKIKQPGENNV